jgi:hypothetical protein
LAEDPRSSAPLSSRKARMYGLLCNDKGFVTGGPL